MSIRLPDRPRSVDAALLLAWIGALVLVVLFWAGLSLGLLWWLA